MVLRLTLLRVRVGVGAMAAGRGGDSLVYMVAFPADLLKRRQKLCLNLLIKKKRIAQLICGKPS
jgi:hypothetical protein